MRSKQTRRLLRYLLALAAASTSATATNLIDAGATNRLLFYRIKAAS